MKRKIHIVRRIRLLRTCILILLSMVFACGTATAADSYKAGFEMMGHTELMPFFQPNGTQTKQFISFDASGGNRDYDFDKAFTKYIDSNGECVIFDEYGPGCLYRQQMNIWSEWKKGKGRIIHPKAGSQFRIKYYFDNKPIPRINMTMDEFFGCKIKPFTEPYGFFDLPKKRFAILYYPFAFEKRLKVTVTTDVEKISNWYQYTYLKYPAETVVQTWAGQVDIGSTVRDQWYNTGKDPKSASGNISTSRTVSISDGEEKTILNLKGKGSIANLKINLKPFTKSTFFNTNIKIYWDGSDVAAVDLPLGYLFGGGGKDYECSDKVWNKKLATLFFGFDKAKGDFYSYWPMPYWSQAKIVIQNNSGTKITSLKCDVEYKPSDVYNYPYGRAGYFCAKRTVDHDAEKEWFTRAFEEKGRGHIVGISFYSEGYDMDGDEFTYIDGSRTPQIHGDGTEDDHNQGWGGGDFQKPLWGGLINGYQGAYRIYMNDCYVFNKDIKINYEYSKCGGHAHGGKTDIAIFYYKTDNGNITLTDELDIGDTSSEKSHSYMINNQTWSKSVTSGYDGYEKNIKHDMCTDTGRAFRGYSRFTVKIDPDNQGVKLKKRINRKDNGVQKADVYIDNVKVTQPWYICTLSTASDDQLWYDSDFEIPQSYTRGKSSITVKIQYLKSPRKGAPDEINEFYYWVFSYSN